MRMNLNGGRGAASRKVAQSGATNAAELGELRGSVRSDEESGRQSALAGLEAALGLIDDVDPAFAAYQPVVAVAATQGFQ